MLETIKTPYCRIVRENHKITVFVYKSRTPEQCSGYWYSTVLLKNVTIHIGAENIEEPYPVLIVEGDEFYIHYRYKNQKVNPSFLNEIEYQHKDVFQKKAWFSNKMKTYLKEGYYFNKKTEPYKITTTVPFELIL